MSNDDINIEQLYCEILNLNKHLLQEMFVIGSPNIEDDFHFVACELPLGKT